MRIVHSGMVLGRYTLEDIIGEGGYATVFAARGPSGELVAVKVLHPLQALEGEKPEETERRRKELETRFALEIYALRTIKSPYVVRYISHGREEDGTLYLVMKIVTGKCLRNILNESRYLSLIDALTYARQLCLALAAAHRYKIVHRDVKPDNIIIGLSVTLVDWGTVQVNGSNGLTNSVEAIQQGREVALGTVDYMPPEQAQAKHVNGASDMFAVGVVLYEMLTGVKLLIGFDVGELYHRLTRSEITPEEATQLFPSKILGYLPKVREFFPENVPATAGIAMAFTVYGVYEVDPELTTPFGERVHNLLVRLTAYHPEDRPTAEEAAAELGEIIQAMHSPQEQTEEPAAEASMEAGPLPKPVQPAVPIIRPIHRPLMFLAGVLGMVAMALVLTFGNRQQVTTYAISETQHPVSTNRPPTIVDQQTKPPETVRVERTTNTAEGCHIVRRHGRPRKICPRPERASRSIHRSEQNRGRRRH